MSDLPNTEAFRVAGLAFDVARTTANAERARCAMRLAGGKVERERLRRALKVAQTAQRAAEQAIKDEIEGEQLAEAVQRRDVLAADGTVLRSARVAIANGRVSRVTHLDRLQKAGTISFAQYKDGVRFRNAFEATGADLYPIGLGEGSGGVGAKSGNRRIEASLASSVMLDRMRSRVGAMGQKLLMDVCVYDLDYRSVMMQLSEVNLLKVLLGALDAVGAVE